MSDYICTCVMHSDCNEEDSCWSMCHIPTDKESSINS
jgi:hypothetical protein